MAIIRSEGGAKGALLRVTLGELVAELGTGFTPVAAQSLPVHEAAPSAADLPLGTLLENEKARAVLAKVLGPMLESPMLAQMKSMSLKKLLSMGGQTLPPGGGRAPPHWMRRAPGNKQEESYAEGFQNSD